MPFVATIKKNNKKLLKKIVKYATIIIGERKIEYFFWK